jgi:hypothetical protein
MHCKPTGLRRADGGRRGLKLALSENQNVKGLGDQADVSLIQVIASEISRRTTRQSVRRLSMQHTC